MVWWYDDGGVFRFARDCSSSPAMSGAQFSHTFWTRSCSSLFISTMFLKLSLADGCVCLPSELLFARGGGKHVVVSLLWLAVHLPTLVFGDWFDYRNNSLYVFHRYHRVFNLEYYHTFFFTQASRQVQLTWSFWSMWAHFCLGQRSAAAPTLMWWWKFATHGVVDSLGVRKA